MYFALVKIDRDDMYVRSSLNVRTIDMSTSRSHLEEQYGKGTEISCWTCTTCTFIHTNGGWTEVTKVHTKENREARYKFPEPELGRTNHDLDEPRSLDRSYANS